MKRDRVAPRTSWAAQSVQAKRLAMTSLLCLSLMAPVCSASAAYMSNSDGEGTQFRTATHADGASVNGSIRSKSSSKYVYFAGRVRYSAAVSTDIGRYTSNTNSTAWVTRGGSIRAPGTKPKYVQSRLCRDVAYLPDPCSAETEWY